MNAQNSVAVDGHWCVSLQHKLFIIAVEQLVSMNCKTAYFQVVVCLTATKQLQCWLRIWGNLIGFNLLSQFHSKFLVASVLQDVVGYKEEILLQYISQINDEKLEVGMRFHVRANLWDVLRNW